MDIDIIHTVTIKQINEFRNFILYQFTLTLIHYRIDYAIFVCLKPLYIANKTIATLIENFLCASSYLYAFLRDTDVLISFSLSSLFSLICSLLMQKCRT